MSGAGPEITIVIPTADRPEEVEACVGALVAAVSGATAVVDAVLVVDNSRAVGVALSSGVRSGVPIRVLREPVAGAARARNRGLADAAGEIVVFVDDDVSVDDGWLDRLVEPLDDAEVVAAVGPIDLDLAAARPRWLTPRLEVWFSALDLGATTRPLAVDEHGWSANLAVRRSAAADIGGFDADLGPGTTVPFGDDSDLLDRLRLGGGEVVYAAGAGVRHRVGGDRLRLRWLARRAFRQGVTDVALEQRRTAAPTGRRPLRALRSLGGAAVRCLPWLIGAVRDPARRPGAAAEQVVLWSARAGAAAGFISPGP